MELGWNPTSNTRGLDPPQHNRPAAFVIAQQYSSATLISLCFYTAWKNFAS
jgi:hypothetical protein